MTRTQAWRKVAEAFDTSWDLRTDRQRDMTQEGLCGALAMAGHWAEGSIIVRMNDLRTNMGMLNIWWWPARGNPEWSPECDAERATFAALMAAMTQRERDQLVKGL